MSHSLDRNKLVVNGTLNINQGNLADDYILVSGTFGEASWLKKQSYVPEKNFDHYVGEHFGGGIVTSVWLEKGVETCLVVATQDVSYVDYNGDTGSYYIEKTMTFTDNATINTYAGASYSSFGASNSNLVVALPGHDSNSLYRGVVQYCLDYVNPDLGEGVFNDWYLPSIMELMTLGDNLSLVNRVLYELGQDIGTSLMYDAGNGTSAGVMVPAYIDLIKNSILGGYDGYWSSTEASANSAYILDFNQNLDTKQCLPAVRLKGGVEGFFRARPFRIATDDQVSFTFDADWMIFTYKFVAGLPVPAGSNAADLDTWTVFTTPNLTGSKVGYLANNTGGWDPTFGIRSGITDPSQFDANNDLISDPTLISNTLIYMGGDNTGSGLETVLINVTRFKQLYPNESYFILDARCAWWITSFGLPSFPDRATLYPTLTATPLPSTVTQVSPLAGYNASVVQYWLNLTEPVVVGVELFKGGKPRMNTVKTWTIADSTAYLNVDSFSKKVVTARYSTTTAAQVKYDLVKKLCTLIKT